mmetsp:Transcript_16003/g.46682  ORF Transcript_16003/g.46682 Transcript_16003/m.46682 type:complete len:281 (-) Transcript_16003:61-903(-)
MLCRLLGREVRARTRRRRRTLVAAPSERTDQRRIAATGSGRLALHKVDNATGDAANFHEGLHARFGLGDQLGQLRSSPVEFLLDHEAARDHGRAALACEGHEALGGAALGEHVIHDQEAVARADELGGHVHDPSRARDGRALHGILIDGHVLQVERRHVLGEDEGDVHVHGARLRGHDAAAVARENFRDVHAAEAAGKLMATHAHEMAVHLVVNERVDLKSVANDHAIRADAVSEKVRRSLTLDEEARVLVLHVGVARARRGGRRIPRGALREYESDLQL